MTEKNVKTGAQKRQVKFSGLIQGGVINPEPNETEQKFANTIEEGINAFPKKIKPSVAIKQITGRQKISLSLIDDSPYQPRTLYDASELDDLGHSMATAGLEEPIRVRSKENGRFEILAGHRRTRSARNLGWVEIDCYIEDCSDREAKLATMISNEARIDLTDFEKGKLYQEALNDDFGKNQTDIANLFGTSQSHVSQRMAMLKLPAFFIKILDENPAAFGVKCATTIAQLIKEYPNEIPLIESAVLRLGGGADQSSVKPWVQQMIKQRCQITSNNRPKIITNKSGRQIFSAKREGRVIKIRINANDIDGDDALQQIINSLKQTIDIEENYKSP